MNSVPKEHLSPSGCWYSKRNELKNKHSDIHNKLKYKKNWCKIQLQIHYISNKIFPDTSCL